MPAFGSKPIRRPNSRPNLSENVVPTRPRPSIVTVPEATAYLQFRRASASREEDLDALKVLVAHHQSEMNAAMPHQPPLVLMDVSWTTLSGRRDPVVDMRAQDALGRWHDDDWCCPAWETSVPFQNTYRSFFDGRTHRLGGAWQEWLGALMSGRALAVGSRLRVNVPSFKPVEAATIEVSAPRGRALRR